MGSLLRTFKSFRWPQWAIIACFLLVSCLTGLAIYRTVGHARSWHRHRDEPIHGWMTVGYVAHTYHVPPRVLYEALGLSGDRFDRRPLREIARQQHRSMDQIRIVLEEAIIRSGSPYLSPSSLPSASPPLSPGRTKRGAIP